MLPNKLFINYKYVKKIYNEECEKCKKDKLSCTEIVDLVNTTYEEKEKSLRHWIKDRNFNKTKIIQEVEIQQTLK